MNIKRILGLDFETANSNRSSACSIGLCVIDFLSGDILEKKHLLIKPTPFYFDNANIRIHGITPEMVENAPDFSGILPEITARIDSETVVVAHNAAFDIGVLRCACDSFSLPLPDMRILCTLVLSRIMFPELASHTLTDVATECGLDEFLHHAADEDAEICAKILLHFFRMSNSDTLEDLLKYTHVRLGTIVDGEYTSCCKKTGSSPRKTNNKDFTCNVMVCGADRIKIETPLIDSDDDAADQTALYQQHRRSLSSYRELYLAADTPTSPIRTMNLSNECCGYLPPFACQEIRKRESTLDDYIVHVLEVKPDADTPYCKVFVEPGTSAPARKREEAAAKAKREEAAEATSERNSLRFSVSPQLRQAVQAASAPSDKQPSPGENSPKPARTAYPSYVINPPASKRIMRKGFIHLLLWALFILFCIFIGWPFLLVLLFK